MRKSYEKRLISFSRSMEGAGLGGVEVKEKKWENKNLSSDYFLMKKLLIYMRLDENFVYEKSKEVQ